MATDMKRGGILKTLLAMLVVLINLVGFAFMVGIMSRFVYFAFITGWDLVGGLM